MFRLLLLIALVYGIGLGLRDGWLVIKWSQLLHNIGFEQVDPENPMNWSEFIINSLDKESNDNENEDP